MQRLIWVIGAIAALAAVTVLNSMPAREAVGAQTRLVLTGSSTVAPLAGEIAKRYESAHPGTRIDVHGGGSGRGIADARQGLAHLGMVSRDLKAGEGDLTAYPLARDGIGIIVHAANPIANLSKAQLVAIYTGRLDNWQALGGRDATITVVHKAEGRSTLELFLAYTGLKNSETRPRVVIGDNEQGIKTVAANPNAIGYVSIGSAEYDIAHGAPIRLVALDGVAASSEHVRDGSYPLARTLNLVSAAPLRGLARDFVEFARAAQTRDLILAQYFVPLAQ